jgi:DNA primase
MARLVFSDTFIQEVLSRTDIVAVVERHVTLKKGGANLLGLCPFHGEKSPSFTVTPSKQFYHCFGCGAHGDAIRFLTELTGAGFTDVVKELAQQVGLPLPQVERNPAQEALDRQKKAQRQGLNEVLERAARHYAAQLKQSPQAITYLKGRGITGEVAKQFQLGYAPPGWRSLASTFQPYDDPQLETAGLVIVHERETEQEKRYDRFRDRIMFPIRSVKGEVIGFGGRVLDGGEPKYLNSPETPVFVKGHELYGLYEARPWIRSKQYVLVVEGYMDVVALAQWGFGHAVATLGTACTPDHVRLLLRFTDRIVFSFDGDAAGRRAAFRALEVALSFVGDLREFRFLFLPDDHDPDSFIRAQGPEAFEAQVQRALSLSQLVVLKASEGADLETPEGRARFLAQARPLWQAMPEGVLKLQVLQTLAEQTRLSSEQLAGLWAENTGPAASNRRHSNANLGSRSGPDSSEPPQAWEHTAFDGQAPPESTYGTSTLASSPGYAAGTGRRPNQGARPETGRYRNDGDRGSSRPRMRSGGLGVTAPASGGPRPTIVRTPLDHVCRILLQDASLWLQLSPAQQDMLTQSGDWHAGLLRWIDRQVTEHGPLEWPMLRAALVAETFATRATELVDQADVKVPPSLEDLQLAVGKAERARQQEDTQRLLGRIR